MPEAAVRASLRSARPRRESYRVPVWSQVLLAPLEVGAAERAPWLILADRVGVGHELAGRLRRRGDAVTLAVAGVDAGPVCRGVRSFNPRIAGHYRDLLAAPPPRSIVHLLAVTEPDPGRPELDVAREEQELGLRSLTRLARSLAARGDGPALRLFVVSTNMHEVSGGDGWSPAKATVLGPAAAIPRELPAVTARSVDFAWPASALARAQMLRQLEAELLSPAEDAVVAYRGPRRWARGLREVELAAAVAERGLRERGVYLVTGALGTAGATLARHLAEACRARLALVDATELPAQDHWATWLRVHGDRDWTSRRIRALTEIQALGGEPLLLTADVTDSTRMRRALEQVESRFGHVNGVLHAAGPRVEGTLVLASLLRHVELDFFVLLSGGAGGAGGADASGASDFLGAYANREGFTGGPVMAIDYPPGPGMRTAEVVRAVLAGRPGPQVAVSPARGGQRRSDARSH